MSASSILKNSAAVAAGSLAAGIGYASLIERNAFAVREVTMPVLSPGSSPLKVLHISDIHMRPQQRRKQAWLRELARLEPDFVVNTGDNLSHPKAVPAVVQALGDLLSVPGVFVFGSNDYFGPRLKNPMNYLTNPGSAQPRRTAALAGPAGGVHRARLAGHDAHPARVRGGRPADRGRGCRRPAPVARPLRDHRRGRQPRRQPAGWD